MMFVALTIIVADCVLAPPASNVPFRMVPPLNCRPAFNVSGFVKTRTPPLMNSCWIVTPGAMSCVSVPVEITAS